MFQPCIILSSNNMNMKFKYFQTIENLNKHISLVVKYSNVTFHHILMTNGLGVTRGKHTSRQIPYTSRRKRRYLYISLLKAQSELGNYSLDRLLVSPGLSCTISKQTERSLHVFQKKTKCPLMHIKYNVNFCMYLYSFISFSSNASYAISKFNELYPNINIYAGLKNLSDSESNSEEYNPTSLLKKHVMKMTSLSYPDRT